MAYIWSTALESAPRGTKGSVLDAVRLIEMPVPSGRRSGPICNIRANAGERWRECH